MAAQAIIPVLSGADRPATPFIVNRHATASGTAPMWGCRSRGRWRLDRAVQFAGGTAMIALLGMVVLN